MSNKKGKILKDEFSKNPDKYTKEYAKELYKKMIDIRCNCKNQKSNEKRRIKYGTSKCDTFGLCQTLGEVMHNSLIGYVADGSQGIIRDDWETIEKHAIAIKEYSEADSWDELNQEFKVRNAYQQKQRAFREALFWLGENWPSLWW